jgi:AcrR family transcriptional regulator
VSTLSPEGGNPDLPDELARLPHGRHGLPAEFVARNQRERLIASFTALLGEGGYGEATIDAIKDGAGVSSRTFYKYFETIEDCYLAAFDRALERLQPAVREAYLSETEWPSGIRAALDSLLSQFSELPDLARLLCAEPFVAGPKIAERHKAVIEQLVPFLRRGRELRKGSDQLPETTEKGLLGGVSSMIGRQAFAATDGDFTGLLPGLLQFLLTPYLGPADARGLAVA